MKKSTKENVQNLFWQTITTAAKTVVSVALAILVTRALAKKA